MQRVERLVDGEDLLLGKRRIIPFDEFERRRELEKLVKLMTPYSAFEIEALYDSLTHNLPPPLPEVRISADGDHG